jgi:hypothetical protein
MIRIIEGLPDGIFGLEAEGVIGKEEFDDVMLAFTDQVRHRYDVALLFDFATNTSRSAEMLKQKFYTRLRFRGPVQRVALVATPAWRGRFADFLEFLGCEGRMFPPGAREDAVAWIMQSVEGGAP